MRKRHTTPKISHVTIYALQDVPANTHPPSVPFDTKSEEAYAIQEGKFIPAMLSDLWRLSNIGELDIDVTVYDKTHKETLTVHCTRDISGAVLFDYPFIDPNEDDAQFLYRAVDVIYDALEGKRPGTSVQETSSF